MGAFVVEWHCRMHAFCAQIFVHFVHSQNDEMITHRELEIFKIANRWHSSTLTETVFLASAGRVSQFRPLSSLFRAEAAANVSQFSHNNAQLIIINFVSVDEHFQHRSGQFHQRRAYELVPLISASTRKTYSNFLMANAFVLEWLWIVCVRCMRTETSSSSSFAIESVNKDVNCVQIN